MKKFNRIVSLLLVLCMVLSIVPALSLARAADADADLWVDPVNGNDANDGTTEATALKTINAAKTKAAELSANGDVVVILKGGTYDATETITFGEAESGKNGNTITYRAASGETALISGGKELDGWTLHDANHNIYVTDIPEGAELTRQFYVDGEPQPMASMELTPTDLYVFDSYGYRSGIISSADSTQYLTVDLGEGKLVSSVTLYGDSEASATTGKAMGFPKDFTIQTSPDGYTWTTQVTETDYSAPSPLGGVEFSFDSTAARYIKIEATELGNPGQNTQTSATQYRLAFAEVQVGFSSSANTVNLGVAQHVDLDSSLASASDVAMSLNTPYALTVGSTAVPVGGVSVTATTAVAGTEDNIKIQVTTDGSNWQTVYTKNNYTWKKSNHFAFNPTGATKVRIINAAEVTLSTITVHAPAKLSASLTSASGTGASVLLDGKLNGSFTTGSQTSSLYKSEIVINLGSTQAVGGVRLYPTYNGTQPTGYMSAARILISTDGVTYHTALEVPSIQTPTGGAQLLVFPRGYNAQYIKIQPLLLTEGFDGTYSLQLDEIEVVPSKIEAIDIEDDVANIVTKKIYENISWSGATPTLGYYADVNDMSGNVAPTYYATETETVEGEEADCIIRGTEGSRGWSGLFYYSELVNYGGTKVPAFYVALASEATFNTIDLVLDNDIWGGPLDYAIQAYNGTEWVELVRETEPGWTARSNYSAHFEFSEITATAVRVLAYDLADMEGNVLADGADTTTTQTRLVLDELTLSMMSEITYEEQPDLDADTVEYDKFALSSSYVANFGYYNSNELSAYTAFNTGSTSSLFDGNYDTYGSTSAFQYQWIPPYGSLHPMLLINTVKSGKPARINAIELAVREDGHNAPYDFEIQVTTSANSNNWITVAKGEEKTWLTDNTALYTFPEMDVYQVRLVATLTTPNSNISEELWVESALTYLQIAEFTLYNISDPTNPTADSLVSQGKGATGKITYDARGATASSDNSSSQYKALRAIDGFIEPLENAGLMATGDTKYNFSYLKNPENVEMHSLYLWYHRIQHFSSASLDGTELYTVDGLGAISGEIIMPTWLSNDYLFLDCPGEWYIDRNEGKIYYMADGTMDGKTAILPVTDKVIDMEYASNITFEGITFSHTSWTYPSTNEYRDQQANGYLVGDSWTQVPAGIDLTGCTDVVFDGVQIRNMGTAGIRIKSDGTVISDGCKIINSLVCDISYSGIVVGEIVAHHGYRDWQLVKNATVQNNLVTRIGIDMFDSVGIFVAYTNGAVIDHNEVAYTPYSGISLGWGWDQEEELATNALTQVGNNQVTNNFVHDVCRTNYDGGAIYTLGWQEGSVISGNYIYNSGSSDTKSENAIYLDEGSAYMQVTGNVIDSTAQSWLQIYFSNIHDNTVTGNYYRSGLSTRGAFVNIGNTTSGNTSFSSLASNASAKAIADAAGVTDNAFKATEDKGFVRQHNIALEFWGSTDGARYTTDCPGWYNVRISGQIGRTYYNNIDNIATIVMPEGTDLSSLTLQYANYSDWSTSPASGTTDDFTDPVTYTVTDGSTSKTWTVKVIEDTAVEEEPAPPVNDDPTVDTLPTEAPTEPVDPDAPVLTQLNISGTVVGCCSTDSADKSTPAAYSWYSSQNTSWRDLGIFVDQDTYNQVNWGVSSNERADVYLDLSDTAEGYTSADVLKLYSGGMVAVPEVTVILFLADGSTVEQTFATNWSVGNAGDEYVEYAFDETYNLTGLYVWQSQNTYASIGEIELWAYTTGGSGTPDTPTDFTPAEGDYLERIPESSLTPYVGDLVDGELTNQDPGEAAYLTNLDVGSAGWIGSASTTGQQAAVIELGSVKKIGAVELIARNADKLTGFELQVKLSDGTWSSIGTYSGMFSGKCTEVITFPAVEASAIRILCNSWSSDRPMLQEICVYEVKTGTILEKLSPTSASTSSSPLTSASSSDNIIDGDRGNWNSAYFQTTAIPTTITFNIKKDGVASNVARMILYAYNPSNYSAGEIVLELQVDGEWIEVYAGTAYSSASVDTFILDFDQDYFATAARLTVNSYVASNLIIPEVEFYGFVSEEAAEDVQLDAPTNLTVTDVTDSSITVTADSVTGGTLKFRLLDSDGAALTEWQTSGTFTGLDRYTKYTVEAMYFGNTGYLDSISTTVDQRTERTQLPGVTGFSVVTVTADSITVTGDAIEGGTLQFRIDGGSWTTGNTFTGLTENTSYTIEARYNRKNTSYLATVAADYVSVTVTTKEDVTIKVGSSYSVHLIEPWALRTSVTFATITTSNPTPNAMKLSSFSEYGAYAIIGDKFDGTTADDLMTDPDAVKFTSANGTAVVSDTTFSFDFYDGLYSYNLDETVYWVAYYVDANGQYVTGVQTKTLVDVADELLSNSGVSATEKAVLTSMKELKDAVIALRGEDADLGVVYAPGAANTGSLGDRNTDYQFGTGYQIKLIEPWGVRVRVLMREKTAAAGVYADYENADDYGLIFFHDKTGKYNGTMTAEQMNAESGALVYSKQEGTAGISANGVTAVYDHEIYTYQLDTKLYCLPYIVVDGEYYYPANATCWNLLAEMTEYSENMALSAEERAVFETMLEMYENVLNHRGN